MAPYDNGNMITLPDRSVYVRMDQTLYDPNGNVVPGAGEVIATIVAALTR